MSRGGVLRPGPWCAASGLLTALLVLAPQLADPIVLRAWSVLAALAPAAGLLRVAAGRRVRSAAPPGLDAPLPATRSGSPRRVLAALAVVLPPAERRAWRAEVAAVLAYSEDPAERRRQALGFALALPGTAALCWRLRLSRIR